MVEEESHVLLGFLGVGWFADPLRSNTKKAGRGIPQKIHAARATNPMREPEAGRMIQTQVISLVIGVVTRGLAATDATSERVGACGTKLLNGFK